MYLLDPEDEVVAEAGQSGAWFATVRHRIEQPGTYTFVVSSVDPVVTFEYGIWLRSCDSAIDALGCGDALLGELTEDDETEIRSDEHYHDRYGLPLSADTRVTVIVDVDPTEPEPFLYLLDSEGTVVAEDDQQFEDRAAFVYRVPTDGEYTAVVTSVDPGAVFAYRLRSYCDPWRET